MTLTADARPTKRFFITNLTRDLSLEDAILDLIDNSVDSFIRTRGLDVSSAMMRNPKRKTSNDVLTSAVSLTVEEGMFRIADKCGGIELEHAIKSVFRFGKTADSETGALGVYGIGLKRAIFKIGRQIRVESHTLRSGFAVELDVAKWSADDDNWELPIAELPAAESAEEAGTTITITDLTPEVLIRLGDGTLLRRLGDAIGLTYTLFLERFIGIRLNGKLIEQKPLPVASSNELKPGTQRLQVNGVQAEIVAGLAERVDDAWSSDQAGWYVLCNGRVVVAADKSELTGWGLSGPRFVSKFRGFLGVAFFFSSDPSDLPWTTTKRGLNLESPAYQAARREMSALARPVLDFLNEMYPNPEVAEPVQSRQLVEGLRRVDITTLLSREPQTFQPVVSSQARRTVVKVQYDAKSADLERIRKKLNKPRMSAGNIGRYTFEYFLKMELAE
jgi:hypothetical protein